MMPQLTIITVTFNAAKLLERTIKSVLSQTFESIEYLIIDGASKDGTLDIIQQYASCLRWVSEPDKGLYDAMNKGLKMATGTYVLFVNAGDSLYSHTTIEEIFKYPNADVYFGEAMVLDAETHEEVGKRSEEMPHRLPKCLTWRSLRYGMVVSHQAFVVRRDLAPLYDLSYRFSSDIDWVIRCLQRASHVQNTGLVISNFLQGGLSTTSRKKSLKERFQILKKHFGVFNNLCNHAFILMRGVIFTIKKGKYFTK